MRCLIYQKAARGLGRLQRVIRLCRALSVGLPDFDARILVDDPIAESVRRPHGVERIYIPPIRKLLAPTYVAPGATLEERLRQRRRAIRDTLDLYDPEFFIIDTLPGGVLNELVPVLRDIRATRRAMTTVFAMRDILDAPRLVRAEFSATNAYDTLQRYYDRVLIFGESALFDAACEYDFPQAVCSRTTYCGYFDRRFIGWSERSCSTAPEESAHADHPRLSVLLYVGGGVDGAAVLHVGLEALDSLHRQGIATSAVLLPGHEMSQQERTALDRHIDQMPHLTLRQYPFHDDVGLLLSWCDVVVSMAGYNTVNEILAYNKPAVLFPRSEPTTEQAVRAERLRDVLSCEIVTTASADVVAGAIATLAARGPRACSVRLDVVPRLLRGLGLDAEGAAKVP